MASTERLGRSEESIPASVDCALFRIMKLFTIAHRKNGSFRQNRKAARKVELDESKRAERYPFITLSPLQQLQALRSSERKWLGGNSTLETCGLVARTNIAKIDPDTFFISFNALSLQFIDRLR